MTFMGAYLWEACDKQETFLFRSFVIGVVWEKEQVALVEILI